MADEVPDAIGQIHWEEHEIPARKPLTKARLTGDNGIDRDDAVELFTRVSDRMDAAFLG